MRQPALLLGAVACGRLGFSDRAAPDAAPPCPLGTAARMDEILQSTAEDWEPALRADGVTLAFSSTRSDGGAEHLYLSTRQGASWTAPVSLSLNVLGTDDDGPAWNAAGDTLYFSSSRSGTDLIYTASFDGTTFGTPQLAVGLSTPAVGPAVSHTELELFFNNPDPGGGAPPAQIYRATRATTQDAWTVDGVVAELDDSNDNGWPSLTPDDLTIYFERGRDVFVAHRREIGQPFDTPTPVAVADFGGQENGDPDITPGGLMFATTEGRTASDSDLFEAPCQ